MSAVGLRQILGLGSYKTVWTWLHKLRRAMVRPGRDRTSGRVEVDVSYWGGPEEGLYCREARNKVLIVVAAEEDGRGTGRICMRRFSSASNRDLQALVIYAIEHGSVIHTDGCRGYSGLSKKGYIHYVAPLHGTKKCCV